MHASSFRHQPNNTGVLGPLNSVPPPLITLWPSWPNSIATPSPFYINMYGLLLWTTNTWHISTPIGVFWIRTSKISTITFFIMSLQDMTSNEWIMDTRATNHVHANEGILDFVSNNHVSRSILVGNGSHVYMQPRQDPPPFNLKILITLHLNNVLITPSITKNLKYVGKFTCQNKCFIEFDKFGFTIMDYTTHQPLIQRESDGPSIRSFLRHLKPQFLQVSLFGINKYKIIIINH